MIVLKPTTTTVEEEIAHAHSWYNEMIDSEVYDSFYKILEEITSRELTADEVTILCNYTKHSFNNASYKPTDEEALLLMQIKLGV